MCQKARSSVHLSHRVILPLSPTKQLSLMSVHPSLPSAFICDMVKFSLFKGPSCQGQALRRAGGWIL